MLQLEFEQAEQTGTTDTQLTNQLSGADAMNAIRMVAVILIVAGAMGLAYGGFSYTRKTHQTKIGPVDISVSNTQTVSIPIWAGIGAIVVGGLLLTVRRGG